MTKLLIKIDDFLKELKYLYYIKLIYKDKLQ